MFSCRYDFSGCVALFPSTHTKAVHSSRYHKKPKLSHPLTNMQYQCEPGTDQKHKPTGGWLAIPHHSSEYMCVGREISPWNWSRRKCSSSYRIQWWAVYSMIRKIRTEALNDINDGFLLNHSASFELSEHEKVLLQLLDENKEALLHAFLNHSSMFRPLYKERIIRFICRADQQGLNLGEIVKDVADLEQFWDVQDVLHIIRNNFQKVTYKVSGVRLDSCRKDICGAIFAQVNEAPLFGKVSEAWKTSQWMQILKIWQAMEQKRIIKAAQKEIYVGKCCPFMVTSLQLETFRCIAINLIQSLEHILCGSLFLHTTLLISNKGWHRVHIINSDTITAFLPACNEARNDQSQKSYFSSEKKHKCYINILSWNFTHIYKCQTPATSQHSKSRNK